MRALAHLANVADYVPGQFYKRELPGILSRLTAPPQVIVVDGYVYLGRSRDVALKEDATRMDGSSQANVVATINKFIVGLAGKLAFTNLPTCCGWPMLKLDHAHYNYFTSLKKPCPYL